MRGIEKQVALLEASKMQNCDENNLTTMRKLAAEHESPTKQDSFTDQKNSNFADIFSAFLIKDIMTLIQNFFLGF